MSARALPVFLVLAIAAASPRAAAAPSPEPDAKITPWLAARLASGDDAPFLVLFDDPARLDAALAPARGERDPRRAVYDILRSRARSLQTRVRAELTAAGIPYRRLYIVNGLALRGPLALVHRLAAHEEVVRIVGDPVVRGLSSDLLAPVPLAPAAGPEWGVLQINADDVWSLDGKRGEGIVVASADTGVEWTHPAIKSKYRGWDGISASHDFNWFDAIADTAAPLDDHNHGTHTTGTMVGDDGAGNQIGVAPGARWIACRNMNLGNGQPSTYIACNQFFLAPYPHGGDPERDGDPSKAPDIVNNSWGCPPSEGCDPDTLTASFAALRAAGILGVAAAGNSGPGCGSVTDPPGIYGEAFVSGASDSGNVLASFSSRGPVTVDGSNRLRPDLAAPGVSVRSAIRGGSYASFSGTSMASPHTAGAAALLWSAKPQVRGLIGITRCLLSQASRPVLHQVTPQSCGGTTAANRPNNLWGYGLLDAYGAIHLGPDPDGDGIASACDCAAADGGSYAIPPEVEGLGFIDATTLSWADLAREAGAGTVYDAIRGDLAALRAAGSIAGAGCLGTGGTDTSRLDPQLPAADAAYYYLVQARNGCGSGSFGSASDGSARTHPACP
ncbi:MAG TPA: S8 family serine peptidase [Candidatus Polarisedimenticolaceae bacterium]|nr:S8 family serine peptidase [Candidatus Polarisedimenticolaceae bacterium]